MLSLLLPLLLLLPHALAIPTLRQTSVRPVFENVTVAAGIKQVSPSFKFGGPLVADLNADGLYDLVLSNHNQVRARVYFGTTDGFIQNPEWQTFNLDVHGVSVGLRTANGTERIMNVCVGGGSGTNPRIPEVYTINQDNVITNVSSLYGLGKRPSRNRNSAFLDLKMRTKEQGRANLGGPDMIITSFLGNPDDGLKQYAYENVKGDYQVRELPDYDFVKRGRIELTDIDNDMVMEVINIRSLEVFKLVRPFELQLVNQQVLPDVPTVFELSVTAIAEIDVDNDGYFDLFVTRANVDVVTQLRPTSAQNTMRNIFLYNQGGVYQNLTSEVGIEGFENSMGLTVGDFNNDGYVDVFVVQFDEPDFIYFNNGDRTFTRIDGLVPKEQDTVGNHAVAFDYDFDGRLDILVGRGDTANISGLYTLFRNVMPLTDNNHYLLVRVANEPTRGVTAIQAVVTVFVNGQRMKRRVGSRGAQGGGASLIDTVHFGLGSATIVDGVRVQWSNGAVVKFRNVKADQKLQVGVV